MNAALVRGQLHEYIDIADNEHLAAIYVLLKRDMGESYQYDANTLKMLYGRLEEDLKGLSKSFTVEEALSSVRNARNI